MFKIDKEKYLNIAKTQGAQIALTALHKDTANWEYRTFENGEGFQADMWNGLKEVRDFSRELWEIDAEKRV